MAQEDMVILLHFVSILMENIIYLMILLFIIIVWMKSENKNYIYYFIQKIVNSIILLISNLLKIDFNFVYNFL